MTFRLLHSERDPAKIDDSTEESCKELNYSDVEAPECNDLDSNSLDISNQNTRTIANSLLSRTILEGRKYTYSVPIDPEDDDRATGFRLLSFGRPHMRAFWAANLGHRATIFMWFSAVPLYDEISESLGFTESQLWISSMIAIAGALISRLFVGFICEKYGPRIPFASLIIFASIPTALQGAVHTSRQFYLARFLVGIGGGSFVASEFWLNRMFKKELAGRVSGFSNGLGLPVAVCHFFINYMVYPFLRYLSGSNEIAWRASFSIISLGSLCVGLPLIFMTDDTPRGNYSKLKKVGAISSLSHWGNLYTVIKNTNVWILCLQHACNLGIELVLYRVLYNYAKEEFNQNEKSAQLIGLSFSLCNQFSRVVGGTLTDKAYGFSGVKGVLQNHFVYLFLSGVLFLLYSIAFNLWVSLAILYMMCFLVSYSQSATFGIVPYVNPDLNGVISGIVGAFGALGGIVLGFIYREQNFGDAFRTTGLLMIFASFLTRFISISKYGSLLSNDTEDDTKILQSDTKSTTDESRCSDPSSKGSESLAMEL